MKVLQINAVYGVGSTGTIVADIHKLALENGIESYIAYSTTPVDASRIMHGYKIGTTFGKMIHAILARINGKQAYFSRASTRKLLDYIELIKPDVIHLHNLHSNYINLNMLLKYLAKKKIRTIVTLHDCWFFTGGCFHYTSVNCDKWEKQCRICPKKKDDTPAYFFDCASKILKDRKKNFSSIDDLHIVGVSKWIESEAKKTFFSKNSTEVIYNGINTDFFCPTESDFRIRYEVEDKFLVLGMANKWFLPINKQTFDIISNGLDDSYRIVIIGCSEQQMKELPSNVIGIPYITCREELREIYSACDVFVNCTREETLSLVNIESQACGTPVITYANTGVKETVDEVCSFSVENGNAEAMLDMIIKLKNEIGPNIKEGCRKWVRNQFDVQKNYDKYIKLYMQEKRRKADELD